ncbi:hypothetical protein BC939DRAFT_476875 [Gamsiella multidivaricata]|uniref:uncharacterized protein n=1 Tax=Gamsiella multidivaricata TaxID=101098 RepID=UPI00221FCFC4|nr:uncharacterized protein BC939DRAFT_476875 [Gamsiella multidivaricata]KAI7824077.1 hypothetical protein BC939DRAFT_476875 [Gamsiella multidivaricata]
MGIDIGFDLFPPLENNEHDRSIWVSFIAAVEWAYAYDSQVVLMADRIEFEVGEHPTLPYKGHRFRRFSSKISGRSQAEPYIRHVLSIAESHFGRRVHFWSEFRYEGEPEPIYTWPEVYAAQDKSE